MQTAKAPNAAPAPEAPAPEPAAEPAGAGETEAPGRFSGADHPSRPDAGTPIGQLRKRLALIMPTEAKNKEATV